MSKFYRNSIIILIILLSISVVIDVYIFIKSTWESVSGETILFVSIKGKDDDEMPTEIDVVKKSLIEGGYIVVDVPLIREIDSDFDERFSVVDSEGNFITLPAILKWVGSYGWKYKEAVGFGDQSWVFTKPYTHRVKGKIISATNTRIDSPPKKDANVSKDPLDAMILHTRAMIKIVNNNKEDCDLVVKELEEYGKIHKAEFEELKKAGEEMEKSMSDDDKKAYQEEAMAKLDDLVKESMTTMMEINNRCPNHANKISKAFNAMK